MDIQTFAWMAIALVALAILSTLVVAWLDYHEKR